MVYCAYRGRKGEMDMKYYVVADPHGYYSALTEALEDSGFFQDTDPHKLIICGDLFDRGSEAAALQQFVLDLMKEDMVILIRGNHEDLALQMLHTWHRQSYWQPHHRSNGTVDTACQLTGFAPEELLFNADLIGRAFLKSPFVQQILPAMVDYFETARYIFVHGWIPAAQLQLDDFHTQYVKVPDWRNATEEQWKKARWINGMLAAHTGATEAGKTIVCGHWHCSYGHAHYEGKGGEFDNDPDYTPYYGDGIIALDACTASTHKVNCIVLEDEPCQQNAGQE